jgi:hypothetical protein
MKPRKDPKKARAEFLETLNQPVWHGAGVRVGGRGKRHPGRPSATAQLKNLPQKEVNSKVKDLVANPPKGRSWWRKEELAHKIGCRIHQVAIALAALNRAGLVTQASRSFAHDTNRNNFFPASTPGWAGNVYSKR